MYEEIKRLEQQLSCPQGSAAVQMKVTHRRLLSRLQLNANSLSQGALGSRCKGSGGGGHSLRVL